MTTVETKTPVTDLVKEKQLRVVFADHSDVRTFGKKKKQK